MHQEVVWSLTENIELLEAVGRKVSGVMCDDGIRVTTDRNCQDMPVLFIRNALERCSKSIRNANERFRESFLHHRKASIALRFGVLELADQRSTDLLEYLVTP